MEEQSKRIQKLSKAFNEAYNRLEIQKQKQTLSELQRSSQQANFWNDSTTAQDTMKKIAKLEAKVGPWEKLKNSLDEVSELSQMDDDSLQSELQTQISNIEADFDKLKEELKFSGPYDNHDAILSIYAGAGGTDAQDWTQILFRMYSRYLENNRWKVNVVDESSGEEAGLKSITIEVEGNDVYGKLKGEHGVHRLVRLSPFNADNLRQTSFAKVEVMPMISRPEELELDDKDLKIDVYRSGGHGGQSVNTTDSAVRVTHLPTGITVAIQNERSQLQNKDTAMTILRSKLAQLQMEQHQDKLSELKGPNQSAEWGNQIRSYVMHPYKQVKDLRTRYESTDIDKVLDGDLDPFVNAYLENNLSDNA